MATTQELLDKLKANITSIYDKLESKGVQVEGNRNLDNLVLAIDNVGSGGGGAEPTPVNLLQAPITLTEDMTSEGYGELMELLNYSFGFEVGKYYIAKGTYGENNTPFELSSMVIDMQGMIMFYAMDNEEALVAMIYDKIAMDEDGNPVPSENSSYIMISGNTSVYPTPITINSISLMNRNSNCLNDIQVPNNSITTTYWHYQEDGVDAYCPIVSANIPTDNTVLDGTIKSLTVKMGDRTLICDGMMLGEIEASVGGYTADGLEFNSFFESEMGSGTLTLIKGYRSNYYIMDEETGDFDYELIKDDTCMCVVGYFMFMDAIAQEEVKDIVYYRPTIVEALSVSEKIVDDAINVFIAGNRGVDGEPRFFDLTKVDRLRDYALSGFYFKDGLYIPENIEYVGDYALAGISGGDIEFDENCMENQSSGTTLYLDNASFNNIKFRSKDCASFKNARQNGSAPIYMASPSDFSAEMFKGAYLYSVNSENANTWVFSNETETYLSIGDRAFAIGYDWSSEYSLDINYPAVTNLQIATEPQFNFDKVIINCPNCVYMPAYFKLSSSKLKEFTINLAEPTNTSFGTLEVGEGTGLTKIVAPKYGLRFRNSSNSSLKYLDVYEISSAMFAAEGFALAPISNLETLILRSTTVHLDKYLGDNSAIMQGITPVYVSDQDLDWYREQYAHTVIVFRGISELA